MKTFTFLFSASRPRFWSYLAGPFLLGFITGAPSLSDLFTVQFFAFLLYFLIPANLLLYGINDYFDSDTDAFNEKKKSHEVLLKIKDKNLLKKILFIVLTVSICVFIALPNRTSEIFFAIFLFLSIFYSMPPLRFKARPFLDSFSNILYALPALIGFSFFSNTFNPFVIISIFSWTAAMHLYSAIPDISADKKAKLTTTAVLLGRQKSLVLCSLLYLLSVVCAFLTPLGLLSFIGVLYVILPLIGIFKPARISTMYWYFPYINVGIGFLLFVFLVAQKI